MEWYKVVFKIRWRPPTGPVDSFFVRATDERDAVRIAEENLDTGCYEVLRASKVAEEEIPRDSITIGARNPKRMMR